jgi:microcystin-dependent protein
MDSFIGEIRPVAFNYAPSDWAICDGSIVNISQFETLFALIGTTYGGNGSTNFALPDLRGRIPIGSGQGTNPDGTALTNRTLGQYIGSESVSISLANLPQHTHNLCASSSNGNVLSPKNTIPAVTTYKNYYNTTPGVMTEMDPLAVSNFGENQAHNNVMPFLTLNYIICINGYFPQRG